MASALQNRVAAAAIKRLAEQATAASQPAAGAGSNTTAPASTGIRTFVHQVAGANTVLPDGRKLVFNGKKGSVGFHITNDPDAIEWLEDLVATPASQITEEVNNRIVRKEVDPAILEAVVSAAENSERAADPQVSAAVNNLPQAIAAANAS